MNLLYDVACCRQGGESGGSIVNGKIVVQTSVWSPFKWFLEDSDDDARKEDVGQMSHVLGLMIGPFLVVSTQAVLATN